MIMQSMTISDMTSLGATVLSLVAVVISIATLIQNKRMIESTFRPYIAVYGEVVRFQTAYYYVIVKNFGQSAAKIESFEIEPGLPVDSSNRVPFQHIVGTTIAPNQAFRAVIDVQGYQKLEYKFTISYRWGKKIYSEVMVLNATAHFDIPKWKAATEGQEPRAISFALQELVEKQL